MQIPSSSSAIVLKFNHTDFLRHQHLFGAAGLSADPVQVLMGDFLGRCKPCSLTLLPQEALELHPAWLQMLACFYVQFLAPESTVSLGRYT